MQIPSFRDLEEMRLSGEIGGRSYAKNIHPNPYLYKYYWWVFCRNSPIDGEQFLSSTHRLNTEAAMELVDLLLRKGEPYWLYNDNFPRRDLVNTPFDFDSPRWNGCEWALPYDDDPDPAWRGHK